VHVEVAALAHALALSGLTGACWVHDTQQWLTSAVDGKAVARGRCTAEGCERELLTDRLHGLGGT